MKNYILTVLRVLALAISYTVLAVVSADLTTPREMMQLMTPEQINQGAIALPTVSVIMTIMLSYLALRSRWHGWKLAGALFLIPYTLYTFLGQLEILAFPAVLNKFPAGMVPGTLIGGLIVTIPFSLLAVWILGKTREDAQGRLNEHLRMSRSEWAWKVAAGALLYVAVYFTFGYYVAFRTPGLPEFYGQTDPGSFLAQLGNVLRDTPWVPPLQVFRGLIWVAVGCIIMRMHKGSTWEVVLATALAFTVLMNASLIFPNIVWPPVVAQAHAVELVSSNLLYGILLALLMLWEPVRQGRTLRAAHYTG